MNGYSHRFNKDANGNTTGYFDQTTGTDQNNLFQSGRVTVGYSMNDQNTFTLAGALVGGVFNTTTDQQYNYRDANGMVTTYGGRTTTPHNNYINSGLEFDWKRTFAQKGRQLMLTTSLTHNRINNAGDANKNYGVTDLK